jgi:hypothetical protein
MQVELILASLGRPQGIAPTPNGLRHEGFRRGERPKPVRCWFRVKNLHGRPRQYNDWNPSW